MHVANKKKSKKETVLHKCTVIKELKAIQVLKTVIKFFCIFQAHIVYFFCSHEPEAEAHLKRTKKQNTKTKIKQACKEVTGVSSMRTECIQESIDTVEQIF